MDTLPFFRLGEKVKVKSVTEIEETKGVHHVRSSGLNVFCMYKNMSYQVFSKDDIGYRFETGVVEGGIYDNYLKVRMEDGTLRLFPHFALKKIDK